MPDQAIRCMPCSVRCLASAVARGDELRMQLRGTANLPPALARSSPCSSPLHIFFTPAAPEGLNATRQRGTTIHVLAVNGESSAWPERSEIVSRNHVPSTSLHNITSRELHVKRVYIRILLGCIIDLRYIDELLAMWQETSFFQVHQPQTNTGPAAR